MKKLILLFAVLAAVSFTAKAHYFAAANADGVTIYYDILDNTARTVEVTYSPSGNKYSGTVNIPAAVSHDGNTWNVTSIGWYAFNGCSSLTNITIPNNVTSIYGNAFNACTWLSTLTFNADSCADFHDDDVFTNCPLKTVTIGNNVKRIPAYFMCNQNNITNITIPNSVTSIGSSAFSGCSGLTNITIPNSVTSIGYAAFHNTQWLENQADGELYLGKVLYKYIGAMPANTNIDVRAGTIQICDSVFSGCSGLTNITIPNSVTSIGSGVFSGCTNLSTLTFNADSCANFYYPAFVNCPLTNVTIGNNVKRIPAFFMCDQDSITNITIPNSVTSIGASAFKDCTNLSTLTFNADYCANFYYDNYTVFANCPLKTVTIGNNVKRIPAYFMYDQDSLTNITIPNSVTSIGYAAFHNTQWLENQADGELYLGKVLYKYIGAMPANTNIDVRAGTIQICDSVFSGCSGLTNITIPNSVTSIGSGVFSGCTNLSTLTFNADSCADFYYDDDYRYHYGTVFTNCPLKTVTIGENVKRIPAYFMYEQDSLTSLTIPNSVTSIGENAFAHCENLNSLNILNGDLDMSNNSIHNISSVLDSLTAPVSIFNNISISALDSTTNKLKYLNVNGGEISELGFRFIKRQKNTVKTLKMSEYTNTELADEAFDGFYLMDTLVLPVNLENISYMAIANCKSLKGIEISALITEIDNSAFENCRMLNSVTFAENGVLERIGNWAFYNCHELQSIAIPEGVAEVGAAAFYGCTYLDSISIPASMQTIGDNAFALCAKMKAMKVAATIPPVIAAKTFENVDRTIPVVVPDNSVADYKAHPLWKEFNIVGEDEVPSATDIVEDDMNFVQNGSTLVFAEEQEVSVYSLSGVCIFSGMATEVNIAQAGVYVVVTETATTKVVVR